MKHYLFFIIVFTFFEIEAQETYRLSGSVRDESNTPIAIADVLLYDASRENLVDYTTLYQGRFAFNVARNTTYSLEVSALGFKTYSKSIFMDGDVELSILLEESPEALEEVEVRALKNPVTITNGNPKINVQHPVFATIPDPLDLLTKLPGLQLSSDRQSISVIGKGSPLIYLNKQRADFEVLDGLSVDGIESIELIQNPSAKYEANGRAVLLITTKRDSNLGAKLSFQETASWKRNYNNFLALNGNYAGKKLEIRGNIGLNNLGPWESNTFQFDIPEADIFSDYFVLIPKNKRTQINSGLGIYLPLQGEDYVSFNTILRLRTDDFPILTNSLLRIEDDISTVITDTKNDNTRDYFTANLNYNKTLSKKLSLFTGLQYSLFTTALDTEISNNRDALGLKLEQLREQKYDLGSIALRIDLEHQLTEDLKLEYGANWNEARADAFSEIDFLGTDNVAILDFSYRENLYATYASVQGKLTKKIDFTSGVRLEYNSVRSELAMDSSPLIARENTRVFPRASLTATLDSTKTLNVNYAKSIERPNFSRTSTISVFINPVLEGAGNINLQPEVTDEISSVFQYKDKSITFGYFRTTNPINFTIRFEEAEATAILSQVNLEQESGFYASLALPFSKGLWTSNTTISLNYNKIEDRMAALGAVRPYLYAYTNHQFRIAKDTTLSLGGWALTRRKEGIFERNAMLVADASLVKTFGEKLQCAIRFNDIFRGLNFEESYTIDGVRSRGEFFGDGREVALSVKYMMGSQKKNRFKNKDVDENIDRIN